MTVRICCIDIPFHPITLSLKFSYQFAVRVRDPIQLSTILHPDVELRRQSQLLCRTRQQNSPSKAGQIDRYRL